MKAAYPLIFGCLFLYFCSCKKSGDIVKASPVANTDKLPSADITDKWNIVVDSTSAGVGSLNYFATYSGKPGDYFGFADNGYVYIKEGAKLDSSSYQYLSDSSIIIHSFVYFANSASYPISHIKTNGANSMRIYLPWLISPGGAFGRSITLSK